MVNLQVRFLCGLYHNFIEEAHNFAVQSNAWTVNDSLLMDKFLIHNIDFVTTDMPELAMNRERKCSQKQLLWGDEFDYKGLPEAQKWVFETGGEGFGNHELQYYTDKDTSNALVDGNLLNIVALKKQTNHNAYTSAKLITKGKQDFKYGKFEIRAKLPEGRGSWPAIWMLSTDIDTVPWPECGEIDIMENVGYAIDTLVGSVHTASYNHIIGTQKTKRILNKNPQNDFHVYGINWSVEKIDFMLDEKVYLTVPNEHKTQKEWPFNKAFYLILNIAVGGDWGGKYGVDDSKLPMKMQIDYVRVFR